MTFWKVASCSRPAAGGDTQSIISKMSTTTLPRSFTTTMKWVGQNRWWSYPRPKTRKTLPRTLKGENSTAFVVQRVWLDNRLATSMRLLMSCMNLTKERERPSDYPSTKRRITTRLCHIARHQWSYKRQLVRLKLDTLADCSATPRSSFAR